MTTPHRAPAPMGRDAARLVVLWGVGGVVALLLESVLRLGSTAISALPEMRDPEHFFVLAVWTQLIVYFEGHRAFHQRFCPLTVARARALPHLRRRWLVVFAPIYAMGLLHGTRKRLLISWSVVLGVGAMIVGIRQLPLAWRGVVDAGVAFALLYGAVSMVWHLLSPRSPAAATDPELADDSARTYGVAT